MTRKKRLKKDVDFQQLNYENKKKNIFYSLKIEIKKVDYSNLIKELQKDFLFMPSNIYRTKPLREFSYMTHDISTVLLDFFWNKNKCNLVKFFIGYY